MLNRSMEKQNIQSFAFIDSLVWDTPEFSYAISLWVQ